MSRTNRSNLAARKRKSKRRKSKAARSRSPRRSWILLPDLLIWAGFFLVPLIFVPGLADEFRLPKLATAELFFGLSCLALALRGMIDLQSQRLRRYLASTVPFVALAFLSVVFGSHPDHGRIALWSMLFGWLVGLCWSGRRLKLERVLRMMMPAALLVAGVAIAQAFGWWTPIEIEQTRRRLQITATIGNAGELASFLVLPAIFATWRTLRAWNRGEAARHRFGWPLGFVLLAAAVTLTQTATALLLIAAVAGGLILFQPRSRSVRIGLAVIAVLGLGAVLLSPAASRVTDKMGELVRGEWAELTTGRTDGWTVSRELLREAPLLGVGFGGFAPEYTATKLLLAEEGVRFFDKHVGQSTFSNAHSEFFEVAGEMGWPGVLALLWLVVLLLRPLARRWRSKANADERETALLHVATFVAMAALSATYFPMRTALLAYPFLFCFVCMLSARDDEAPTAAGPPSLVGRRRWMLVLLVALLVVQSGWVSWQRIRSSADLRGAESVGQSMIQGGRVYPTILRRMIPVLEGAWERTPWDERIPMAIAGFYVLARDAEQAEAWYRRSFDVALRPESIDSMGRLLHSQGRVDEALPWFVRAVRLDRLRIRSVPDELRSEVRRQALRGAPRRGDS